MAAMKVGLVGCGNIAADICRAVQQGALPVTLTALTDVEPGKAEELKHDQGLDCPVVPLEENAARSDFLVECATGDAVPGVVAAAIEAGCDCLILSLGGLLTELELLKQAREGGVRLRLPSGALCGLDGIRAAREGGLDRVTLTTRKPPQGLSGAPYLAERGIDVDGLSEALTVFEGTALEAVKAFPKNVNVAAALSLAGLGPENTTVRVVADPAAKVNSHEVEAEGAFGRLKTVTENRPSPRNPKTSYLASLSAIAELRRAAEAFVSG
ncbi:MAG: aspartate dehydrogenase [Candidatus Hydrogenedentota bacterium]